MAISAAPLPSGNHSALLQLMSPDQVTAEEDRRQREKAVREQTDEVVESSLVGHIRRKFEMMRRHRSGTSGWAQRMLDAQRTFNRKYSPSQLAEIKQLGGSEIYAGITATKCRGTTSLLREVYLEVDKPWGLSPTPEPDLPLPVEEAIAQLIDAEIGAAQAQGAELSPQQIQDRTTALVKAAREAAKKQAREQTETAESKINDYLVEGGFYTALADILVDLPIFPFACIKGPMVRLVPSIKWNRGGDGQVVAERSREAKMFWGRVSPFDIFFTPGVSNIADADVIEIQRFIRADLNALIGVPGYREDQIRLVLNDYGARGFTESLDETATERAEGENRESPSWNESGLIDCMEFHGNIQGSVLRDWGMTEDEVPDRDLDYFVQAWVIGRYVIKCQIHPSPRDRHIYFITSFEKVPGTPVGNALPDILRQIESAANATLRTLINNQGLASGPQVVLDTNRIMPGDDNEEMYPWKVWRASHDPFNHQGATQRPPIEFFQPQSNAQELMVNYEKFSQQADELSAIPRYITGSDRMGGAGRTASGLAMLMGNANKILKTVCSNIDREIIEPVVSTLYDFMMLYDRSGTLRGDEEIVVHGVQVAVQRETNRMRQLELLQATANPVDLQIMGTPGRASLLRSVSNEVGLKGEQIIPSEDEIKAKEEQAMQAQAAMAQMAQMQEIAQKGERSVQAPGSAGSSGPAPAPANMDLGVQEAASMRGMGG